MREQGVKDMRKGTKGFTLVELLVVIVIIGILASLLLPAISKAIRNGKLASDANNLKQLWTMQANYMAQFGGRAKLMPPDTGAQFWVKLTLTSPPLIDTSLSDIYDCPLSPSIGGPTPCEYRGPSADLNTFNHGDPVGADNITNHGAAGSGEGGIVIRKSGDAMNYSESDPVWAAAGTKLN